MRDAERRKACKKKGNGERKKKVVKRKVTEIETAGEEGH